MQCSDEAPDPALHCPAQCETDAPSPLDAPRVRRGLSTLSAEDITRFANAVHIMKNLSTAEGQAIYGPSYREASAAPSQPAPGTLSIAHHP